MRTSVLADIAESLDIDRSAFENAFTSAAMRDATRCDFAQTQAWGIRGFPALIAGTGPTLTLIASGYTDEATLSEHLERLRAQPAQVTTRS